MTRHFARLVWLLWLCTGPSAFAEGTSYHYLPAELTGVDADRFGQVLGAGDFNGDGQAGCQAQMQTGSSRVTVILDQDIDRAPFLIDGPPQIVLFSVDLDEHFIEVPNIVELLFLPQTPSRLAPELPAPLPDCLVREDNSSFGEKVFTISEAQGKAEVESDCVADDPGRESQTAVADGLLAHG